MISTAPSRARAQSAKLPTRRRASVSLAAPPPASSSQSHLPRSGRSSTEPRLVRLQYWVHCSTAIRRLNVQGPLAGVGSTISSHAAWPGFVDASAVCAIVGRVAAAATAEHKSSLPGASTPYRLPVTQQHSGEHSLLLVFGLWPDDGEMVTLVVNRLTDPPKGSQGSAPRREEHFEGFRRNLELRQFLATSSGSAHARR